MTDLATTRWRKFGKDRLYVKTAAGLDVGYIDLLSGAVEVQVAEFDAEVRALAPKPGPANASRGVPAAMVSAAEPTSPASEHRAAEIPRSLSESVPPLAVAPLGYDLTDNRAGAAPTPSVRRSTAKLRSGTS